MATTRINQLNEAKQYRHLRSTKSGDSNTPWAGRTPLPPRSMRTVPSWIYAGCGGGVAFTPTRGRFQLGYYSEVTDGFGERCRRSWRLNARRNQITRLS